MKKWYAYVDMEEAWLRESGWELPYESAGLTAAFASGGYRSGIIREKHRHRYVGKAERKA